MAIFKVERKENISQFINEKGKASIAEICAKFNISEATVRRDLDELSSEGSVKRIHGGAVRFGFAQPEPPVFQRKNEWAEEKDRIGLEASKMVAEGETIFLGSGTTVLTLTQHLTNFKNITVISNSLPVINTLVKVQSITMIALGGLVRFSELSMIGHITDQAISELRADKVFMGIRSIHLENGLTNDYLLETQTDRTIVKMAEKVIIVADHSKFGRISPAFVAPLSAVDTIITDSGIDTNIVIKFKDKGINIIIA